MALFLSTTAIDKDNFCCCDLYKRKGNFLWNTWTYRVRFINTTLRCTFVPDRNESKTTTRKETRSPLRWESMQHNTNDNDNQFI